MHCDLAKSIIRFHSKYIPEPMSGCWLWIGLSNHGGYGQFSHKDSNITLAHRFSYFIHYDINPGENVIRHKCNNRACVNPEHLSIGTQADNMQDVAESGRRKGENHAMARLTRDDVIEIRRIYDVLKRIRPLAKKYGVSNGCIQGIVGRKTWKHI